MNTDTSGALRKEAFPSLIPDLSCEVVFGIALLLLLCGFRCLQSFKRRPASALPARFAVNLLDRPLKPGACLEKLHRLCHSVLIISESNQSNRVGPPRDQRVTPATEPLTVVICPRV
jgi:hypothetical protein